MRSQSDKGSKLTAAFLCKIFYKDTKNDCPNQKNGDTLRRSITKIIKHHFDFGTKGLK